MDGVEAVLRVSARGQRGAAGPFYQFLHLPEAAGGDGALAKFARKLLHVFVEEAQSLLEFPGNYGQTNGIGPMALHGGAHLYIWSAVCMAWNIWEMYEYCCCMVAIKASAAAI